MILSPSMIVSPPTFLEHATDESKEKLNIATEKDEFRTCIFPVLTSRAIESANFEVSYLPLFQLLRHNQRHQCIQYSILLHPTNTAPACVTQTKILFIQNRSSNNNILSALKIIATETNLSISSKQKSSHISSVLVGRFGCIDYVSITDLRPSQFVDPIVSYLYLMNFHYFFIQSFPQLHSTYFISFLVRNILINYLRQ